MSNPSAGLAEVELALLERRRADILDRMNSLANAKGLPGMGYPEMHPGMSSGMSPGMSQGMSSFMGAGVGLLGVSPAESQLRRQMLGARQANTDMAKFFGYHNSAAYGGVPPSLMGNPYGL
jgi:hypothetical protein